MGKRVRNAVCRKLEKGNGSVGGMKMLLPIGSPKTALVQVTVVGIDFNTYGRGIQVKVSPRDGAGYLAVDAAELIDDTAQARDYYFRRAEAEQFVQQNAPRHRNERDWRACLTSLRARLTDPQREQFDAEAKKVIREQTIKQASNWELEKLLPVLAAIKFDVFRDDMPAVDDD